MGINQVLIVDDEEPIRALLQRCVKLARPACRVVTATNGTEALARLQTQPFDLIILDYQMPRMNGLDLAQAARQLRPAIKLMLITGSRPEAVSRAIDQNIFDGYLDKPFTPEQFITMLNNIEHRLKIFT